MSMSLSGSGETGSGSVEVSVRTDLTVTSDGDSEDAHNNPSKRYAKEIYTLTADKTQLQQVVEKLRLELQGRDAQLLATKGRYETLLNQMSSSNGIKLSEKQAIINRLESNLRTGNEETRVLKERAANELAHLMEKCQQFQQKQERLKVKHDEVKATLNNIHISEAEFNRLKLLSENELNLQQVVSVRLHEIVVPLQLKIKELETIKASLGNTLLFRERDLENVRQENIRLEHHVGQLSRRLIDSTKEYEDLRKDLKQDDYRIYNFDRIKQERDKYEKECEIFTKEKGELEWSSSVYKKEKEVLEDRLSELKTKLRNQELELLRSQMELQDVRKHFESGKENTTRTYSQLKSERERSENFQEKYLKARTELISLSESLTDCKNEIKLLNDKLMFVTKSEEDVKEKYENLLARYNDISQDLDMMQGKSLKEKDLYKQEINELKANFFTLSKNNTDLLNDNIKLQKEVKDSKDNQADRIKAIEREDSDLRREVSELKRQLDVYKTLEDDYLSTLQTFASVPLNLEEGDCRYTSGIPALSIVKGKLSEETISLTRRILTLERSNVEACTTIQKLTACLSQMRSSIASYKAALSMAGKPSAQLFERITSQEEQILGLEIALKASNESKQGLSDQISKLKNDLKEALNHIKEAGDVKREIESIRKELNSLPTAFIDNKIYNNENSSRGRPPLNLPSAIKITKLGSEKKV